MGRNKKDTPGYSTPQDARTNKKVTVTMPPDAVARLDALSKAWTCSKSEVLARLLRGAKE